MNWNASPRSGLAGVLILLMSLLGSQVRAEDRPRITRIDLEGTNVVVTARVPAGLRKLTLESRARLGAGAWVPRTIARLDGNGIDWTFRLPRTEQNEMLRVRADPSEPFPSAFYQGTNVFFGPPGGSADREGIPGPVDVLAGGGSGSETDRAVVESDIWKIEGDTLYFFNQYRGLQVIDIADPDAPALRGTLSLPATGEQMYLIHPFAILLTRECDGSPGNSSVVVVDTSATPPRMILKRTVEGTLQESRLVGRVLYLASETYRPVLPSDPNLGTTWEWGTLVSAFDLADPSTPMARGTLWFAGSGNVVTATDRWLFVATRDPANGWRSVIQVIDITDEHGSMTARGKISPRGLVADKFKMNLAGDVFSVVSESWSDRTQWTSVLENFSLARPQTPELLGGVVIKAGERLFATRFDGNRAYVVTFQRIDPLFVVDLSDPRQPRVAGEVEVPGWSTYIHPLGDRLVTIGVDNTSGWRVAVSLFDVQDPAKPRLLSRVPVGENQSWSEANTDEKAFGILPESGLLLVPYQGYTTNGYASRVQLIDLGSTNLTARGTVDHTLVPRRATLHRNRVLSLSGRELLALDASDRDHPLLKGSVALAWRVDRVVLHGGHLLQLAASGWEAPESLVRVAAAEAPDRILAALPLGPWPILGTTIRDGRLLVLQGRTEWWWPAEAGGEVGPPTHKNLSLTVLDLSGLPALKTTARLEIATRPLGWGTDWKPLWVRPGLLVWSGGGGYWGWWVQGGAILADVARIGGFWGSWYGNSGGRLIAMDVTDLRTPALTSDLNLITGDRRDFSRAFTASGKVFLSHASSEFMPTLVPPGYVPANPVITRDPATGLPITNEVPVGTWVQKHHLDVVDFADPAEPTVRPACSLPGRLSGLSHDGEMLYTVGLRFDPVKWTTDPNEWLSASAYDGVEVHLVDSLALPQTWPHPLWIEGTHALLGRPSESSDGKHVLETWTLSGSGRFARVGATLLESPAQNLTTVGSLLAVQGAGEVSLYNASKPSTLSLLSRQEVSPCLGFDLTLGTGSLQSGFWLPLNDFGTFRIPLP
jgi:hypothetical protein